MKTKKNIVAIMIMVLAIGMTFVSCKKEREMNDKKGTIPVSKEVDMTAYLKHFKERMQSEAKGDEPLSLDDARWHLEAVLNYTYGDAGHETSDIQRDTFNCIMHTNGGEVTLAQLNDAFNTLSIDVEKAYNDCNFPEKSVLAIQTSFVNNSKDGDVIVQTVLSTRGLVSFIWPPRFGDDDYWDEHDSYGKCGPYEGECIGRGATTELTRMATLRMPQYACDNEYRSYLINYYDWTVCPDDSFLYDENSPSGLKIYYRHSYDECIPPDEMNYYLSKSGEIIEHYKPAGKIPVSIRYFWDEIWGIDERDRNGGFHCVELIYATLYCEYVGPEQ